MPRHVKQAYKGNKSAFRYREENHVNHAVMAHVKNAKSVDSLHLSVQLKGCFKQSPVRIAMQIHNCISEQESDRSLGVLLGRKSVQDSKVNKIE